MFGLRAETAFDALIVVWLAVAAVTFFVLLRVRAPYGRHVRGGWGPAISHRLGWFVMELPALTVFAFFLIGGSNPLGAPLIVFLCAWQVHYLNRTVLFPLRIPPSDKRMPIVIVGTAVFFNSVNGWLNGYYLGTLGPSYSVAWLSDARFLVGVSLFIVGFLVNLHSDNILLRLRRSGDYDVPHGGLFRWISCPNYLGEIVEWCGFAIMTWSPAAAAFAIWTAANLVPRALSNHRWYIETFDGYPKKRKALVPRVV